MHEFRHAADVSAVASATVLDPTSSTKLRKGTQAERFAQRLVRLIQRRAGRAIHALRVEITPHGITLYGNCAAFYLKQLAQEAVLAVIEDQPLFNRIEVQ